MSNTETERDPFKWKCDECSADAPGTGRFIEHKPLVDDKWLCDPCFDAATSSIRRPDGSLNLGGISPETREQWKS